MDELEKRIKELELEVKVLGTINIIFMFSFWIRFLAEHFKEIQ